ncbi:MAG: thiamine pyrophosphate-binding protein [Chloroflexota bacterium]|nr:thiamine pyrophosphate-binding protein [Chloroflexota bacterium]
MSQGRQPEGAAGRASPWISRYDVESVAVTLRAACDYVVTVPCSAFRECYPLLDPERVIAATREDEAIGIASGIVVAGGRASVVMQNSGLGNSVNVLASLNMAYSIGLPIVMCMRGTGTEDNPAQIPMGEATVQLLDALGLHHLDESEFSSFEALYGQAALRATAFGRPVFILLNPRGR